MAAIKLTESLLKAKTRSGDAKRRLNYAKLARQPENQPAKSNYGVSSVNERYQRRRVKNKCSKCRGALGDESGIEMAKWRSAPCRNISKPEAWP